MDVLTTLGRTMGFSFAAGINLYATVAVTKADGTVVREPVYRITALTNDPNHIGVLLTMPIVLVLALATDTVRRTALLLATLAVELTIALALSQSRSRTTRWSGWG